MTKITVLINQTLDPRSQSRNIYFLGIPVRNVYKGHHSYFRCMLLWDLYNDIIRFPLVHTLVSKVPKYCYLTIKVLIKFSNLCLRSCFKCCILVPKKTWGVRYADVHHAMKFTVVEVTQLHWWSIQVEICFKTFYSSSSSIITHQVGPYFKQEINSSLFNDDVR